MTYADAHGRDECGPIDWALHHEWVEAREAHVLSTRRAETTKIAMADLERPANHLRLALGVAAGALLAAGTVVASSFGSAGEVTNTASSVPDHAVAAVEQPRSVTVPPAVAPPPAPVVEQPPQETPPEPASTEPASTEPGTDDVAAPDPGADAGANQRTPPSVTPPPPAPAPEPPQDQQWESGGHWGSGPQGSYDGQWGSGSQWGSGQWGSGYQGSYGGQWGSGSQWGSGGQWGSGYQGSYGGDWGSQWRPVDGFGAPTLSSYSDATVTPTGPAMSMLDPFCG